MQHSASGEMPRSHFAHGTGEASAEATAPSTIYGKDNERYYPAEKVSIAGSDHELLAVPCALYGNYRQHNHMLKMLFCEGFYVLTNKQRIPA